jgi:hypothetical protein
VARDDLGQALLADGLGHELDVGEREVAALEEEGIAELARERVGEAVTQVEPSRVPDAAAEAVVGHPGDSRLLHRERLDLDPPRRQPGVEGTGDHRVAAPVDHRGQLHVAHRREEPAGRGPQEPGEGRGLRLVQRETGAPRRPSRLFVGTLAATGPPDAYFPKTDFSISSAMGVCEVVIA